VKEFRRAHDLLQSGQTLHDIFTVSDQPLPGQRHERAKERIYNSTAPPPPKPQGEKQANEGSKSGDRGAQRGELIGNAQQATSGGVRLGGDHLLTAQQGSAGTLAIKGAASKAVPKTHRGVEAEGDKLRHTENLENKVFIRVSSLQLCSYP
jgi:hypothetical protein